MPSRHRVDALIRLVEEGKIVQAIDEFYDDSVVMQDNKDAPTVGKTANRAREQRLLDAITALDASKAVAVVVEDQQVAIHWILDITTADGARLKFDQVALQTWKGDKIVSERFFYDTATLTQ